MTPELASFSDWVLALLPRLFLFPGGLWMIAGLVAIKLASGGIQTMRPQRWASDIAQMNPGGAAIAWAALALLPLPGTARLPTPVDTWVLLAMLAVSLLIELDTVEDKARRWIALAGAGITLALLVPLAHSQGLLATEERPNPEWISTLVIFSVGLGITALIWAGSKGIGAEIRALAWVGIALTPFWDYLPFGWLSPTFAVFALAALVWRGSLQVAGEAPSPTPQIRFALLSQWLLALVALLALLFSQ